MDFKLFMTLIKKVESGYKKRSEPIIKEFNISCVDFDIIMFLQNNPQYYTAKDISSIRRIKPNVLSTHVQKLVDEGYILRQGVPQDRRKVRLLNTQKAQPIIEKGVLMQKEFFDELFKGLKREDIEKLKYCMEVVCENADLI